MNKGYYFEGVKYSKEEFNVLMQGLQVLKEISEACENCHIRESCNEDCILFKLETSINNLISEVKQQYEQ